MCLTIYMQKVMKFITGLLGERYPGKTGMNLRCFNWNHGEFNITPLTWENLIMMYGLMIRPIMLVIFVMKINHILSLLLKFHSLSFFIESIYFYAKYSNHFFAFFSLSIFCLYLFSKKHTPFLQSRFIFLFFNQKSGFHESFFSFSEILEG